MNVISKNKLLSMGASHANFLVIRKQINAESNGRPSTLSANQPEADEEIAAFNFFPLSH
ncbi:MAG: hypothetical protein RI909_2030 [Bacteroidota bacterium]